MKPVRAFIAIATLIGAAALPASASHEGAISGTVTNVAGDALPNICVDLYVSWDDYSYYSSATNDAGAFSFDWLTVDESYILRFTDCSDARVYATEWFDDVASRGDATLLQVSGDGVTQADAVLARGGSISGIVTDEEGRPISDLCTYAVDADGDEAWAYSAADGSYAMGPLQASAHSVRFGCDQPPPQFRPRTSPAPAQLSAVTPAPGDAADYISEWFDNASSQETATPVPVAAGLDTPAISASLTLGGSISGTVTDEAGAEVSACVTAFVGGSWRASAETSEGLGYKLRGLPAGTYNVQFWDCDAYRYRSEWYEDALTVDRATPLTVTLGTNTPGVDASLVLRPVADLAITGLTVRAAPTETDVASVPLGTQRDVTVDIANLGTADSSNVGALVWVEMENGDTRTLGAAQWSGVRAGDRVRRTYRWDSRGAVGDAQVHAVVCLLDDASESNNWASTRTFAVVGGTGEGLMLQRDPRESCYWYPWW